MNVAYPDQPLSTREEQRRLTRTRITHAARVVFEQHGYGAASVGDIASTANVNRATFYLHFTDKAAVLNQVYADIVGETAKYWSRLDHTLTLGTPASVRDWLSVAMGWWEEYRAILPAMHEAMAADLDVAARWKTVLDGLAAELRSYLDNFPTEQHEDVQLRVQLLVVQLDQVCFRYIVQGVFTIERDHLLDLLTDMWCATLRLGPAG
jgi:AcrR family transcriptional regulator